MDKLKLFETIIKAQSGVLYIKGKPGIGKTCLMQEIARRNGWQFFDIRLAQMDETEVNGGPDTQAEIDGQKVWANKPPVWLVKANSAPSLVMFDEINRSRVEVRNAAMQILNERMAGHYKINDNVYMVAVGNLGDADGCEVEDFDNALNNRLIHYEFDLSFPEWKKGFADKNVNSYIVSYLESNLDYYYRAPDPNNPDETGAYPTPRSWTFLSDLIGKKSEPADFLPLVKECAHSYIGSGALSFIRYLEDTMQLNINDIVERFTAIKSQVKKLNRDRKSELLAKLKKKDILKISKSKDGDQKLSNIAGFLNLIDEDERVAFLNDYLDSVQVEEITGNKKFKTFLKEFANIFEKINILSK